MEQPNDNPNQATSDTKPGITLPKGGFRPLAIRNLFPGMLIGILIGIAGFLAYQRYFPQVTQIFYIVTLTTFGVLIASFILIYAFKRQITTLIFGSATANAKEVIDDAQKVTDALTDRFANTLLQDVAPDVRQRVRHVLPRLANWFIWRHFRNWWWQWFLGIFVALGGLTGTILLMNQNELLSNQNNLLDNQNHLIEHQINLEEVGRQTTLMNNILDKVYAEIENQKGPLSKLAPDTARFSLSSYLIIQIINFNNSLTPYRYFKNDTLIQRPLSPIRGKFLMLLSRLPLDKSTLSTIYNGTTFANADLEFAFLSGTNLSEVILNEAELSEADLIEADLTDADLTDADLSGARLYRADLSGADLSGADLRGADLRGTRQKGTDLSRADLRGANFSGVDLSGARLNGADLSRADLRGANFSGVDLSGARLNGADLSGADLNNTNLKGTNLTLGQAIKLKSLYSCFGLHDSIKTVLMKTHPTLFEEPKE